jgi:hypothetical protein
LIKGVEEDEAENILKQQNNAVFMRGALNFDDYNYSNINKHVLINNTQPHPDPSNNTSSPRGKGFAMESATEEEKE